MKTIFRGSLAAISIAAGFILLPAVSASADGTNGPLCTLNSNAYQYDAPLGNYERTVHAWYQFRVHGSRYDAYGRLWYFGHSGESWWDDGYVLSYHVTC